MCVRHVHCASKHRVSSVLLGLCAVGFNGSLAPTEFSSQPDFLQTAGGSGEHSGRRGHSIGELSRVILRVFWKQFFVGRPGGPARGLRWVCSVRHRVPKERVQQELA